MSSSLMEGAAMGDWTNVQDPVKQMITAITKAVRTQSAGIKDIDKRVDAMPTNDILNRRLEEVLRVASDEIRSQLKPVGESMKKKANVSDLSALELNTLAMAKQLDKINELLHSQNNAILNLNARISGVAAEVGYTHIDMYLHIIYTYTYIL
jgi:hypothetical protein